VHKRAQISIFAGKLTRTASPNYYTRDIIYKKLNNKKHWGPFAILIKDMALATSRNSNIVYTYLKAPEIVEQICIAFKDELGIDLLEDYRKESKPVIVKFKDQNLGKRDKYENYFMTALYFLYCSLQTIKFNSYCDNYYSGYGDPIPPDNISKIIYL